MKKIELIDQPQFLFFSGGDKSGRLIPYAEAHGLTIIPKTCDPKVMLSTINAAINNHPALRKVRILQRGFDYMNRA